MTARSTLASLMFAALLVAGVGCSKSDLSSPKAAAKTFATAMTTGDAETAKKASTGVEPKVIESMAAAMGNMKKLHDAAVAKFGDEGKAFAGMGPAGDDDMVKKVEEATEEITGETATVKPKDGHAMKLKKVDGSWKVDLAEEMAGPAAAMGTAMFDKLAAAAKTTTDEIAAGKYKNAAEAKMAMGKSMMGG